MGADGIDVGMLGRAKISADEVEVRVTSGTGGAKGQKLARFDLVPVAPLEEVAKAFGRGTGKYAERNWEAGYAWGLSYAAAMRHMAAFWDGESFDTEMGSHHLAAAVFHLFALMEFELKGLGSDDRA